MKRYPLKKGETVPLEGETVPPLYSRDRKRPVVSGPRLWTARSRRPRDFGRPQKSLRLTGGKKAKEGDGAGGKASLGQGPEVRSFASQTG